MPDETGVADDPAAPNFSFRELPGKSVGVHAVVGQITETNSGTIVSRGLNGNVREYQKVGPKSAPPFPLLIVFVVCFDEVELDS